MADIIKALVDYYRLRSIISKTVNHYAHPLVSMVFIFHLDHVELKLVPRYTIDMLLWYSDVNGEALNATAIRHAVNDLKGMTFIDKIAYDDPQMIETIDKWIKDLTYDD